MTPTAMPFHPRSNGRALSFPSLRAFLALTAALALAGTARADQRKLTVDDAVQAALASNPSLRAMQARIEAAHATSNSIRGHYLPAFNVSDEVQHWNSNFAIAFPLPAAFAAAVPGGLALTARDIDTNSFVVAVDQPLVQLLEISQNHLASIDDAAGAEQQEKAMEAGLREMIGTDFLRLFEARATGDIARTSQQQLGEQLSVAKSKRTAGVLTDADVLRVEVAVANARQQEIQAQTQEMQAKAAILSTIHVPPTDATFDFEEPKDLENAAAPPDLATAFTNAQAARPEIAASRSAESSAQHRSTAGWMHMLPQVDFEAAYMHITGQVFAQVDSGFAGFKLNWPFWQWGADFYAQRAAQARQTAAELDTENLRDQIGFDLSSKLSIERSSTAAVEVANTAITSAEEAYRVEDALVKAGSATTTDLLDSQSALTQAKLNLVRARYEQAIARVSVKRAMGG